MEKKGVRGGTIDYYFANGIFLPSSKFMTCIKFWGVYSPVVVVVVVQYFRLHKATNP